MGKYETGSRAAAPLWLGYRKAIEKDYAVQDFQRPSGIVMARVDAKNGLLAGPGTEESYLVPFKAGTQPTEISTAGVQQAGASGSEDSASGGSGSSGGGSGSGDMLKQIF
jgi:penicillin-binding protein 1A